MKSLSRLHALGLRSGAYKVLCSIEHKLGLRLPLAATTRWRLGLKSEIEFWDEYFRTKGGPWPEAYRATLDPNSPLQAEPAQLLPKNKIQVSILDVGAGPLTFLGKKHGQLQIQITAVDPLADEYDKILRKHAVVPLVRTEALAAEKLSERFKNDTFDLVYARNCIDHAFSPENAILQMLKVVKTGCYVLLVHRQNEAVTEGYQGLHQWNFATEDGDFMIASSRRQVNFSQKYRAQCDVQCRVDAEDWLSTIIRKH